MRLCAPSCACVCAPLRLRMRSRTGANGAPSALRALEPTYGNTLDGVSIRKYYLWLACWYILRKVALSIKKVAKSLLE